MHKRQTSCGGARRSAPVGSGSARAATTRWGPRLAIFAFLGLLAATHARSANAVTPASQANTSRQAREDAIRRIPFQMLDPKTRRKLSRVVSKPTIFRRLPTRTIECDPDMFVFLVRHPEVVVNIWELMGVTSVKVQRTGDYTMRATDGAGTTTNVELVYGSRNQHIIFAEGYYDGSMTRKRLTGRCVMLLTSDYKQDPTKAVRVINQLDVFLQLDNFGADLIARTLHPIMGRTADHNFFESSGFLAQLSTAAEQNSHGVQRLAQRLELVRPEVREQFAGLAVVAGQRAVMRQDPTGANAAGLIAAGQEADTSRPRMLSPPPTTQAPVPLLPARQGLELRR